MLNSEGTLKPERIEQLEKIMGISTKEFIQPDVIKHDKLTVNIRGESITRRSKRELDSLLFAINDY